MEGRKAGSRFACTVVVERAKTTAIETSKEQNEKEKEKRLPLLTRK